MAKRTRHPNSIGRPFKKGHIWSKYSIEKRKQTIKLLRKEGKIQAPNWQGGQSTSGTYIIIWKPEHPFANCEGYIMEHRLVIEGILGRYLGPNEVVHHIDGNPRNNEPRNLILFKKRGYHLNYHRAGKITPEMIVWDGRKENDVISS